MVLQKTPRPPLIAPTKKNKSEHRTAAVDVTATHEVALAGAVGWFKVAIEGL